MELEEEIELVGQLTSVDIEHDQLPRSATDPTDGTIDTRWWSGQISQVEFSLFSHST